jgi:uncharacterized glyoxalase superfamily protein PhnB
MTDAPSQRPAFGSALACKDVRGALDWLEKAFGFDISMVITDDSGAIVHSEMQFNGGYLMVASEWAENIKAPSSVGGANTQSIHVHLSSGIDQHCERARAAGAKILQEPQDQFYGDRTYRALDPEGHMWTFGQTVQAVSREEAEKASGLKIEGWT